MDENLTPDSNSSPSLASFGIPFIFILFFSMVLFRIPAAVQPMTGIEGFKYQASDG